MLKDYIYKAIDLIIDPIDEEIFCQGDYQGRQFNCDPDLLIDQMCKMFSLVSR